ncbi:peptidylprolyl isomerase [Pediococcus ethanolidurans]|nr:peptidylprolyl isomerase [Pediococcus ethanolidurans]GEN94180.1 foldase protein PrsA 1 [Pediococcus ethanolidurans]SER07782.1 foldase protein PrsA [Pediococcus ethanolidurans]
MKMSSLKKIIAITFGTIIIAAGLTGCGNGNSKDKTVVSMKGSDISQSQYYKALKQDSSAKTVLQKLIVTKSLENEYGKKVSKSDVNKVYTTYENQYGDNFSSILKQNSYTKKQFKQQLRENLLMKKAVKASVKITNKDLKKQFKVFEPKVQVAEITVKTESEAKKILKKSQANNADFAKLAKEYSTDTSNLNNGGKLPAFDNTNTSLDAAFTKAAFTLKTGEIYKSPVKTSSGYEIIKMIKNPGKGKWQDHKTELKAQILAADQQDSKVMKKVLSKLFKENDIKIKDSDLKDALAGY